MSAYVYSGAPKDRKRFFAGEVRTIKGPMPRHSKLKSSLTTLMRYAKAAQESVKTATTVPARYLDE